MSARGLRPRVRDSDGDGIDDSLDKCPTISAAGDQTDSDGDGIGDLCDLGPEQDTAVFVSFADGIDSRIVVLGAASLGADELTLGTTDARAPQPIFLAGVTTDRARVDIGFEIIAPPSQTDFHEVGIAIVGLDSSDAKRGDVCFVGYDATSPYVEKDEDSGGFLQNRFGAGTLVGKQITWSAVRTPDHMVCTALIDGSGESISIDPIDLVRPTGEVGIWTDGAIVKLHYMWIVTPRP